MSKKKLRGEHGLTLMELLATIIISSFIMLIILSAFLFIQKQHAKQTAQIRGNTDITIALKAITKDIRQATTFSILDEETLTLTHSDQTITYALEGSTLKKNGADYISNVAAFTVTKLNQDKIKLYMKSENEKEVKTELIIRGEIDHEDQDDET